MESQTKFIAYVYYKNGEGLIMVGRYLGDTMEDIALKASRNIMLRYNPKETNNIIEFQIALVRKCKENVSLNNKITLYDCTVTHIDKIRSGGVVIPFYDYMAKETEIKDCHKMFIDEVKKADL